MTRHRGNQHYATSAVDQKSNKWTIKKYLIKKITVILAFNLSLEMLLFWLQTFS